jgi:LysM repeat protein
VEKVAEKAGKAAPAVAIAGVLVAGSAPAAHAAVKAPATTSAAAVPDRTAAGTVALVRQAQPAARSYTVRSGDSLSKIADGYYGHAADWEWIYEANRSKISNPNEIYVGERLTIPAHAPASTAAYTPKHAKAAAKTAAKTGAKVKKAVLTSSSSLSGTLGCTGLETLWEAAGGSHSEAFMAAEIAMAESGGRQYALSPTNDYGYWQINGSHGPAEATFNPMGNAKAAIAISDDGTNWDAWTTYTSGAYGGRC